MSYLIHSASKRVAVAEDWYPTKCYGPKDGKLNQVEWEGMVSVRLYGYDTGMWRVCVWGGDDFGLEFDCFDQRYAISLFDRINHLITIEDLYSWRFKRV